MIRIDDKAACSGCGACYNVCPKMCISMTEDEEGFLYPIANEKICINCGLCEKVCPLNEENNKKYSVIQSGIIQNKNESELKQSTSGGAFTPIAKYVVKKGGVVFGVKMSPEDCLVKHAKVETEEELEEFRNSKYVQSYIGYTFREAKNILDQGKLVCFSGTPCQIQGLKNYLQKDYDNLITVDVVCRGVPSPGVWRDYSNHLKKKGNLRKIRFRDKSLGYQYSTVEVTYENGIIDRNGIESDQWLRMFFSGMILRPSCPTCNFRSIKRCSDFTIWDCFNVSDFTKKFDETKGVTRILIHTDKGKAIFEEIKDEFYFMDVNVNKIAQGITETALLNNKKSEFISDYGMLSMEELLNKWFPMSLKFNVKKYVRRFLNIMGWDLIVKKFKRKISG